MALTVTPIDTYEVFGAKRVGIVAVACDASYVTGGYALTAADLSMVQVDFVVVEDANGYNFEYDHTNSKLIARYNDYDAVADGPHIQVPNATNLSAVTDVRVFALGQ